jgi:hypothetical protein
MKFGSAAALVGASGLPDRATIATAQGLHHGASAYTKYGRIALRDAGRPGRGSGRLLAGHLAVGIAVISAWTVQVTAYEIIGVIAVRNGIMPAARTVSMGSLVAAARVVRRAGAGVGGRFG